MTVLRLQHGMLGLEQDDFFEERAFTPDDQALLVDWARATLQISTA